MTTAHTGFDVLGSGPLLVFTDSDGVQAVVPVAAADNGPLMVPPSLSQRDIAKIIEIQAFIMDNRHGGTITRTIAGKDISFSVGEATDLRSGVLDISASSGTRRIDAMADLNNEVAEAALFEGDLLLGRLEAVGLGENHSEASTFRIERESKASMASGSIISLASSTLAHQQTLDPEDWDWEGWDDEMEGSLSWTCKSKVFGWVISLLGMIAVSLAVVGPIVLGAAPTIAAFTLATLRVIVGDIVGGLANYLLEVNWSLDGCDDETGFSSVADYVIVTFGNKIAEYVYRHPDWFYTI